MICSLHPTYTSTHTNPYPPRRASTHTEPLHPRPCGKSAPTSAAAAGSRHTRLPLLHPSKKPKNPTSFTAGPVSNECEIRPEHSLLTVCRAGDRGDRVDGLPRDARFSIFSCAGPVPWTLFSVEMKPKPGFWEKGLRKCAERCQCG